jgi:hypothetical protein
LFFSLTCYCYQIQETDEARKKFSNAKSISSAQFFGDQSKATDVEAQASLQKFSVCALTMTYYWKIYLLDLRGFISYLFQMSNPVWMKNLYIVFMFTLLEVILAKGDENIK